MTAGRRYNSPSTVLNSTHRMKKASGTKQSLQELTDELVRKAGLRMTRQRRAVLETVLNSCDHPTAAIIFERVRKGMSGISLATIYNCLETLAGAGIINHLHFDNGPSRFCANLVPHVHLLDDTSNTVVDVRLKPGLHPEDIFELPEGARVCRMDACLRGFIPAEAAMV